MAFRYLLFVNIQLGGMQMQCPTENELDCIGKQQKC